MTAPHAVAPLGRRRSIDEQGIAVASPTAGHVPHEEGPRADADRGGLSVKDAMTSLLTGATPTARFAAGARRRQRDANESAQHAAARANAEVDAALQAVTSDAWSAVTVTDSRPGSAAQPTVLAHQSAKIRADSVHALTIHAEATAHRRGSITLGDALRRPSGEVSNADIARATVGGKLTAGEQRRSSLSAIGALHELERNLSSGPVEEEHNEDDARRGSASGDRGIARRRSTMMSAAAAAAELRERLSRAAAAVATSPSSRELRVAGAGGASAAAVGSGSGEKDDSDGDEGSDDESDEDSDDDTESDDKPGDAEPKTAAAAAAAGVRDRHSDVQGSIHVAAERRRSSLVVPPARRRASLERSSFDAATTNALLPPTVEPLTVASAAAAEAAAAEHGAPPPLARGEPEPRRTPRPKTAVMVQFAPSPTDVAKKLRGGGGEEPMYKPPSRPDVFGRLAYSSRGVSAARGRRGDGGEDVAAAPRALSALSGVSGLNDLAQSAEYGLVKRRESAVAGAGPPSSSSRARSARSRGAPLADPLTVEYKLKERQFERRILSLQSDVKGVEGYRRDDIQRRAELIFGTACACTLANKYARRGCLGR